MSNDLVKEARKPRHKPEHAALDALCKKMADEIERLQDALRDEHQLAIDDLRGFALEEWPEGPAGQV